MTTHTPGPWHKRTDMRWARESVWSEKGRIAWLDEGSAEGDVYLIATAPEMYETLAAVSRILSGKSAAGSNEELVAYIDRLLAEARGEKP